MMNGWHKGVMVVGAVFLFGGCATVFPPGPSVVSFQSTPPGAEVSVNGVALGQTPLAHELSCLRPQHVTLTLAGYQSYAQLMPTVPGWESEGLGLVIWPVDRCAPVVSVDLAPLQAQR